MSKPTIRTADQIVTVETATMLHMAEHERLLSFNGDTDALHFDEWWRDTGRGLFASYVNKQKGDR